MNTEGALLLLCVSMQCLQSSAILLWHFCPSVRPVPVLYLNEWTYRQTLSFFFWHSGKGIHSSFSSPTATIKFQGKSPHRGVKCTAGWKILHMLPLDKGRFQSNIAKFSHPYVLLRGSPWNWVMALGLIKTWITGLRGRYRSLSWDRRYVNGIWSS